MDVVAYSRVFDSFLLNMEQINDVFSDDFSYCFEEVCQILRIGKIEFDYYDNPGLEAKRKGQYNTPYNSGRASSEVAFRKRHVTRRDTILILRMYMVEGAQEWDEDEYEKVTVFATMIYSFLGRAKLSKFAEHAMFHDRELMIPNMAFLHRQIAQYRAMGMLGAYCVCFFNLKRFSVINQAVGRKRGTKVIIRYIGELQDKLGNTSFVCRAGGDNFVALFRKSQLDLVKNHLEGTEIRYDDEIDDTVLVRSNAGVYFVDDVSLSSDQIVEKAHIALNIARNNIERICVTFDRNMQLQSEKANAIENDYGAALANEEFLIYYQTKVDVRDNKVAGAEALCRWLHDGEIVPPNTFIPVLEQSNAICSLDFYILEHVCQDIRRWLDSGLNAVKVSVNFSRRHLGNMKLLTSILNIVDKYNVPHELIEIELTETTTDVGFSDLQEIVSGLHANGIQTSVDDFGVGYSSLNLIRQVPWDVIKIDKSFLPVDPDRETAQYKLFSHLLSLFRDMGLQCLVEGVETLEQVEMLKENECFLAQGYLFDKPLPVDEFEARIK